MNRKTRIILADDHPIFLAGLRNLVCAETDLDFIGEASTGLAALKLILENRPDLAIVDIPIPELNGIVLSRRITAEAPSVRIMILTLHEDRSCLNQALQAGVRGYLLKRSAAENLVQAIRAVMVAGLYVDPAIASRMFDGDECRTRHVSAVAEPELTSREAETLRLVALGETNKEIARRLDVSVKTIETFKSRGAAKMGLRTRADIVRYAANNGLLTTPS